MNALYTWFKTCHSFTCVSHSFFIFWVSFFFKTGKISDFKEANFRYQEYCYFNLKIFSLKIEITNFYGEMASCISKSRSILLLLEFPIALTSPKILMKRKWMVSLPVWLEYHSSRTIFLGQIYIYI